MQVGSRKKNVKIVAYPHGKILVVAEEDANNARPAEPFEQLVEEFAFNSGKCASLLVHGLEICRISRRLT
jgi:hypothetical protein